MNSVEILIGKWDAATRELSTLEDGTYWRLVRWCYANESLVPLDTMSQRRVAGAHTDDEHRALDKVLEMFFERTPTGYQQKHTWKVIKSWKEGEPEREAAAAAGAARREASRIRMREMKQALKDAGYAVTGNLPNEMLVTLCETYGIEVLPHWRTISAAERFAGQHQGLPSEAIVPQGVPQACIPTPVQTLRGTSASDASGDASGASGASGEARGNPSEAMVPQDSASGIPVRAPDTEDQYQIQLAPFGRSSHACACAPAAAREQQSVTPTRRGMAGLALKRGGLSEFNLAHPKLQALLDAGVTDDELQMTATECATRGKGFAYVLAVIEQRRREAQASGPVPAAKPSLLAQWAPSLVLTQSGDDGDTGPGTLDASTA